MNKHFQKVRKVADIADILCTTELSDEEYLQLCNGMMKMSMRELALLVRCVRK